MQAWSLNWVRKKNKAIEFVPGFGACRRSGRDFWKSDPFEIEFYSH